MPTDAVASVALVSLPVLAPQAGTDAPPGTRRECDGCTVCCTALTINDPQLVAPAGEPCPHLAGGGCSIHRGPRPAICGAYVCHYLMSEEPLTLLDRPDRTGAIVGYTPLEGPPPADDCLVHLVEHRPQGLQRILERTAWRRFLRSNLAKGRALHAVRWDDPQQQDAALLRWTGGSAWLRLQPCDGVGAVQLGVMQPVYARPVPLAVDHPEWGYPFEARALRRQLGARAELIVGRDDAPAGRRFRFTRWQAYVSVAIERLMR